LHISQQILVLRELNTARMGRSVRNYFLTMASCLPCHSTWRPRVRSFVTERLTRPRVVAVATPGHTGDHISIVVRETTPNTSAGDASLQWKLCSPKVDASVQMRTFRGNARCHPALCEDVPMYICRRTDRDRLFVCEPGTVGTVLSRLDNFKYPSPGPAAQGGQTNRHSNALEFLLLQQTQQV